MKSEQRTNKVDDSAVVFRKDTEQERQRRIQNRKKYLRYGICSALG